PAPADATVLQQADQDNIVSEILRMVGGVHPGAALIGLLSIAVLVLWDRYKPLKRSIIPAPLVVVLVGVGLTLMFRQLRGLWALEPGHLVQVPVADSFAGFLGFLQLPDFAQWSNRAVYSAAVSIAAMASLATLLNLEATDKLDPLQRTSPPSREL